VLIYTAVRRNEAASWLRRTVGVVCARDLAEDPSEEEFRVGLRSGIVLCNAVNKIQPGTVPKVAFVSFKFVKFLHRFGDFVSLNAGCDCSRLWRSTRFLLSLEMVQLSVHTSTLKM
jgi:hypothetical protein